MEAGIGWPTVLPTGSAQSTLPSPTDSPEGCPQHSPRDLWTCHLSLTKGALQIQVRLLRWEIILDYPGEPGVVTRPSKWTGDTERTAGEWAENAVPWLSGWKKGP